jgi:hypothetical protein
VVWDVGWSLGDFEICNSPKYLFDQDHCIGSCTCKASCIAKQDEKHSKEPVNIPEMYELDEDNMMTQCAEGYITMIDDDSGVSLPSGLIN